MRNTQPTLPRTASLYLDIVRFASAATVFVYHLSYRGFGGQWLPLHEAGGAAVMAFFVLSGFIIAATAQREPNFSAFMNARLARLWSVVLPALLLTFVLDGLGQAIDPKFYAQLSYNGDLPVYRLVASGLFLNEIWFRSIAPLSNLPFWSLGYEFWYYAVFAAAFYFSDWKRYLAVGGIALLVGPKILLLLPVWLLGVLVWRISRRWTAPEPLGWLMFVAPAPLYAGLIVLHAHPFLGRLTQSIAGPGLFERFGESCDCLWFTLLGVLIAIHLLGFFSVQRHFDFLQRAENPVRRLAGCTFSCYLFHFPLFMFFAALLRPSPDAIALNLVIGALAALVIAIFGPPVEASRHALRHYLDNRVRGLLQINAPAGVRSEPEHRGLNSLSAG